MTSVTTLLILFTAITAISGKALDFSIDTDRPITRISYRDELLDTMSRLKLTAPEHNELDLIWPLWTKLDVLPPSPKADTFNTKAIVSHQGNRRERRQALVKTRGIDDGPDSVMSLISSSHPLNMARFPNGDIVNYTAINIEVKKWIRQQLIIDMLNKIQKSTLKNRNRQSS